MLVYMSVVYFVPVPPDVWYILFPFHQKCGIFCSCSTTCGRPIFCSHSTKSVVYFAPAPPRVVGLYFVHVPSDVWYNLFLFHQMCARFPRRPGHVRPTCRDTVLIRPLADVNSLCMEDVKATPTTSRAEKSVTNSVHPPRGLKVSILVIIGFCNSRQQAVNVGSSVKQRI